MPTAPVLSPVRSLTSSLEPLESRIAPAAFVVTNLNDAGEGSLRDAIDKANVRPGADSITFAADGQGEIVLTTGEIEIKDRLTITGAGKVTINAEGESRIFNIDDNNSNIDSATTLSGLNLINGFAENSSGGAVVSTEGLKIVKSIISGNTATFNGGGVLVNTPTGAVTVTDTHFTNNRAVEDSFYAAANDRGGGLFVETAKTVTITRSQFANNQAQGDGGGVFIGLKSVLAKAVVTGSTFINNEAGIEGPGVPDEYDYITGKGGGMMIVGPEGSAAQTTITSTQFINNTSEGPGGGVFFESASLTLSKSTFSNNNTSAFGGGLSAFNIGKLIVKDSAFENNSATTLGGGLAVQAASASSTISLSKLIIEGNFTDDGEDSDNGAGLAVRGVSQAAEGNQPAKFSTTTMTGLRVSGNLGNGEGGGIYLYNGGNFTLQKSTIVQNSAGDGAGLYADEVNSLTLTSNLVSGNFANGGLGGGGAFVSFVPTVKVSGTQFLNNNAAGDNNSGGGLYVEFVSSLNVSGSTFGRNQTEAAGGGLFVTDSDAVTIISTIIANNTADGVGGGLNISEGEAITLNKVSVLANSSTGDTGGAFLQASGLTKITAGTISQNNALGGVGGLTLAGGEDSTVAVSKTTFVFNRGSTTGGILVASALEATFTSALITQNVGTGALEAGGLNTFTPAITKMVKSKVFGNLNTSTTTQSDTRTGPPQNMW